MRLRDRPEAARRLTVGSPLPDAGAAAAYPQQAAERDDPSVMSIRQQQDSFLGTERFSVRRRLGAGGMGVVYEAYDRERDQCVALKTILRLDATSLYRFKREFRSLADVSHPNLVRLHELFSEGDRWFFTMELVEGQDFLRFVCPEGPLPADDPLGESVTGTSGLFERTASQETEIDPTLRSPDAGGNLPSTQVATPFPDGQPSTEVSPAGPAEVETETYPPGDGASTTAPSSRLDPASSPGTEPAKARRPPHPLRLRAALRQLAEALIALHSGGKLHRDIKPSNVLVTRRGRVVLMDFGLSTEVEDRDGGQTTEGLVVGTASYMSPEQAGGQPLSPASDWYSVGVMLYRALTGQLPFKGRPMEVLLAKQTAEPPPPKDLAPDVPDELNDLCSRLLSRDPSRRPTGEEMLERLGGDPVRDPGGSARPASHARPFVGREPHLAGLSDAFAAVARGRASAVFVHGVSGAGKSTLVQRFLDGLTERGEAVVLAGRCYEQESVAYKALDTLIDALSRFLRRLNRLEAEALLPRDASALARVFPVLRRVEAIADAPLRAQEVPDLQELRRRAFAALRELLARIGDRKPLVLYIDDLQWGDLDSAALLSDLLRPPDPPVLMLLCCYRREYVEASPCLKMLLRPGELTLPGGERREVAVDALTPGEVRALALSLMAPDDPLAGLKADMIVRESGGSPFFVFELARFVSEGGDLDDEESTSQITLDDVLWRRISRLPDDARLMLEAIALAGQPIRQSAACRAVGLGAEGYAALGLLRNEHLIRGTGPGSLDDVETYHDRVREAVLKNLPADSLPDLHLGLARELEATRRADPETLAVHFEAAGEPARAGRYYAEAAAEAADALAFDRAAKLYRRAMELIPPGEPEGNGLRSRLGDALANAGRGTEAARAYLDAAEEATDAEALVHRRNAAYQFLISGHIDEGLAEFRAILDRVGMPLPGTPGRALTRLLLSRALLRLRGLGFRERDASAIDPRRLERIDISRSVAVGISVVDVIRGSDFQTRSLLQALRAGEPLRVALALGWEAVHSACSGLPNRRRTARLIAGAGALANKLGHPHALGMADLSAGAAAYLEARYRSALELSDRAAEVFRDRCTGVVWELDTAQIFGLWSLIDLGHLGELRRRFLRLFKEARGRGDRYMESTLGTYIGALARLSADEADEARDQNEGAIRGWSQHGYHIQHLNHFYAAVGIDLYRGDGASAWRRIGEDRPRLERSLLLRIQDVRIDVHHHAARAALAAAAESHEPGPLLDAAEEHARRLDREGFGKPRALSRLIRAGIRAVRGDVESSARLLAEAIKGLESAELGLFAASARRRLGEMMGGDEGRHHVRLADEWMRSQSIQAPARMASLFAPGFPGRS